MSTIEQLEQKFKIISSYWTAVLESADDPLAYSVVLDLHKNQMLSVIKYWKNKRLQTLEVLAAGAISVTGLPAVMFQVKQALRDAPVRVIGSLSVAWAIEHIEMLTESVQPKELVLQIEVLGNDGVVVNTMRQTDTTLFSALLTKLDVKNNPYLRATLIIS